MEEGTEKPIVAHYCTAYLPLTQAFVYSAIAGVRRFQSHVVCQTLSDCADLFPLTDGSISVLGPARFSSAWLLRAIGTRFLTEAGADRHMADGIVKLPLARKFRLIHAHFGHVGAAVLEASRKLGVPLVTNFYGSDTAPETHDPSWPERRTELFAKGALFLVEGPFMRQRLIDLGCPPEKVRLQRISFRFDQLPRKRAPEAGRVPVLLFAGRFVEKKGLRYALEAMAELHRSGARFEFRIIGGGPMEAEHRGFVAKEDLGDKVRFLGMLPRAAYLEELAQADIFVSPSVTASNGDTEGGAPTTILEAQALEIPIVSTTHADIPNITVPGVSALLAEERDSGTLAQNLGKLMEDRSAWARMGSAGREFVAAHHDVAREAVHLEEAYFSVLGATSSTEDRRLKPEGMRI